MIGTYKFTQQGLSEFRLILLKKSVPVLLLMLLPFFCAPIFIEDLRDFGYVIAMIASVILMAIGTIIGVNMHNWTTIEITENTIIRYGKLLERAELKYSDIGLMEHKKEGLRIFKEGLNKRLALMTSRRPLMQRKDIIFIPMGISSYESIVNYIKLRLKEDG